MAKLDQPLIGDLQSGGPVGNPRAAPGNTHVGKPMVKAKGLLETAAENFKPHFTQYAAGEFEVGQAEARGEKIASEWMNNVNEAAKLQNVNAELGEMEGELAMGPPTAEDDVRINELVAKRNKLMDKVDRGFMSTTDVQLRIEKMARELAVNHPNPDRVYAAAGSTLARDFGVEFKLLQAAEKQQAASKDAWRKDILKQAKEALITYHGMSASAVASLDDNTALRLAGPYLAELKRRQAVSDDAKYMTDYEAVQGYAAKEEIANVTDALQASAFATLRAMTDMERESLAAGGDPAEALQDMAMNLRQQVEEFRAQALSIPGATADMVKNRFQGIDAVLEEIESSGSGKRAKGLLQNWQDARQLSDFRKFSGNFPQQAAIMNMIRGMGEAGGAMATILSNALATSGFAETFINSVLGDPPTKAGEENEKAKKVQEAFENGVVPAEWRDLMPALYRGASLRSVPPSSARGANLQDHVGNPMTVNQARGVVETLNRLAADGNLDDHAPAMVGNYIALMANDPFYLNVIGEQRSKELPAHPLMNNQERNAIKKYTDAMLYKFFREDMEEYWNDSATRFHSGSIGLESEGPTDIWLRDLVEPKVELEPGTGVARIVYTPKGNLGLSPQDAARMHSMLNKLNRRVGGFTANHFALIGALAYKQEESMGIAQNFLNAITAQAGKVPTQEDVDKGENHIPFRVPEGA